jgi:biotin operon repressor
MREEIVLAYLQTQCKGKKNTRKSNQIEADLHISGNELRKQVNRLRRKGKPIASSQDGYFFAVTAGEIYSTIRKLKEMDYGLRCAIRGLEESLDNFGGDTI